MKIQIPHFTLSSRNCGSGAYRRILFELPFDWFYSDPFQNLSPLERFVLYLGQSQSLQFSLFPWGSRVNLDVNRISPIGPLT